MPATFTLGKKERLKSRKQIEELFDKGQKFSSGSFRIYFVHTVAGLPGLRFGAGVSTKNFKKATDRNRVKRLTREAWRTQKNALRQTLVSSGSGMNVFVIYTGKTLPAQAGITAAIKKIITRLDKVCSDLN